MTDLVPLVQFPAGQSPALAGAVAALLCAVVGAVQVVNGVVTAVNGDEAATITRVMQAAVTLQAFDAVEFEQARWLAAAGATREATSA